MTSSLRQQLRGVGGETGMAGQEVGGPGGSRVGRVGNSGSLDQWKRGRMRNVVREHLTGECWRIPGEG